MSEGVSVRGEASVSGSGAVSVSGSGAVAVAVAVSDAVSVSDALLKAVRAGRTSEVVSLLDGMTDAERRLCLPVLKELRKELRVAPWDARSREAYPTLHAAGAACHTGAAGAATWLTAADMRWSQASPAVLLHVLGDRGQDWLGNLTRRLADRPETSQVPYELMAGLVRLSRCAVPTTETYVVGWVEQIGSLWERGDTVLQRLRQDPYMAELVPALFEIPDIGSHLDWLFGDGPDSWFNALATLTEEGFLDRKVMIDACVARLLRGSVASDCRVFLKLLKALEPSRDEERQRASDWLALVSHAASAVASHAQSVLGALALAGEATPRQLAEMTSVVLFRPEKKMVRAQLVLLGKALRRDPSSAAELLPAVAQAFGHEDTDVQERALKLVERHIGAVDPRARGEVAEGAVQLSAGLRARAVAALGLDATDLAPQPYLELLPPVPLPARLAPAPDSVTEVAEEVGALLVSADGDTAAFERALDGLVRHAYLRREELAEALRPVAARSWWMDTERHHHSPDEYFRNAPHGLELVLAALLGRVRMSTLQRADRHGPTSNNCVHSALAAVLDARLWEAAHRVRTDPLPFLLATPTWSSGFLEPDELVARLGEYHRLGARPGEADFTQALLRLRRDDRAVAASAAERAAALGTTEGQRLARWLTGEGLATPTSRRRVSATHILLELGELDGLPEDLPQAFRQLGLPVGVHGSRRYCHHYWNPVEQQHWLAVLPGWREMVAARLMRELATVAVEDTRGAAAVLPLIAEAEGEAGEAVHLCVAYGLGARHPEDRLSAVDALLVLAARGHLDAEKLGTDLAQLVRRGAVKPLRLAESVQTAATTGAYGTVWSILRAALPVLLADLASEGAAPAARGFGELLAVAAECAERTEARGDVAHLGPVAERRGSSRLVTQARRLRTALEQEVAA
ncbi:hypothetical protein GCM10017557_71020 [Streptomyces aurantiacus]|uniref:DUF7824 domain-containing protein n=1 Tax=Streptomyces aurantiacus TaxID=47760 RepID=A0A7G1P982_9ACTN|nr:hypothetical protein GCM10017557_71020 [Streptomyces aurantiacus]